MLLGLYRMRAFAQYINSCPQPSYNLFAPAATVVQTADPGSPALTHYGCQRQGLFFGTSWAYAFSELFAFLS
jgi:hypothetical protein